MSPIPIQYHPTIIRQQLNYLIRLDYIISQRRYVKFIIGLLVATALFLACIFLTPGNEWVTPKGVFSWLFAIVWLLAIGMVVRLAVWWWKRVKWKKAELARAALPESRVSMAYDSEALRFWGHQYYTELKW